MDQHPPWERGRPARPLPNPPPLAAEGRMGVRARGPRSDLRYLLPLAPLLCAAVLSGCSSSPDKTEILVGTTPPGASCLLTRLGQPIATVAPTPAIALVEPNPSEI